MTAERLPVEEALPSLRRTLAAHQAVVLQAPPGAGKTFVLAHLARQLVADGQRVFVTALTHRALNNALEKIAQGYKLGYHKAAKMAARIRVPWPLSEAPRLPFARSPITSSIRRRAR